MHLITLRLFPMTALHCHVGIIGDRDQKVYHRNFASVLNCLRRHYKKTVAESCDNKLCVFMQ